MSKGNKASMIMQILLSPIRILGKAPKLYTKSMMSCAGGFGYVTGPDGAAAGCSLPELPRSYSTGSFGLSEKEEEYRELLMALESKRIEMNLDFSWVPNTRGLGPSGMGIRSYSVGIGKIGKIDEERTCSFREDDVVKSDVYPRCRSNALLRYK